MPWVKVEQKFKDAATGHWTDAMPAAVKAAGYKWAVRPHSPGFVDSDDPDGRYEVYGCNTLDEVLVIPFAARFGDRSRLFLSAEHDDHRLLQFQYQNGSHYVIGYVYEVNHGA